MALGYGVLKEQNLEGYLPPVEGGLAPVVKPPQPPEDHKTPSGPASGEETDLGMSRDVPIDPETGIDEALKIGYRVVTGTYSKIPLKPPAPPAAKP